MKIMFSLLIVLSLIFAGCCSKDDPENISNGTVVDENTVADTDSLAQILQTWVPEVPVDSVEKQWNNSDEGNVENQIFYEIIFSCLAENKYEYYSDDGTKMCVIQYYQEQNGLQFTSQKDLGLIKYTQTLNLLNGTKISVERFSGLYSGNNASGESSDSLLFSNYCSRKNGTIVYNKNIKDRLDMKCESVVDLLISAHDYLLDNVEKLKPYCK